MSGTELKICGGQYAGKPLRTPDNNSVRPMRSRIRAAVFDRISDGIRDRSVLDCFAGTGAVGLEALSRGARAAVFLDKSREALSCVRRNVESLDPAGDVRIIRCDLLEQRPSFYEEPPFYVISVTPPYRFFRQPDSRQKLVNFLSWISQEDYLMAGGEVFVECETGTRFGRPPGRLVQDDVRTFGNTEIHRFRPRSN